MVFVFLINSFVLNCDLAIWRRMVSLAGSRGAIHVALLPKTVQEHVVEYRQTIARTRELDEALSIVSVTCPTRRQGRPGFLHLLTSEERAEREVLRKAEANIRKREARREKKVVKVRRPKWISGTRTTKELSAWEGTRVQAMVREEVGKKDNNTTATDFWNTLSKTTGLQVASAIGS